MISGLLLGLDIGERYVGVAVADTGLAIAIPREAWIVNNNEEIINNVKKVIASDDIVSVVVGLPVGMKGNETDQTTYTREIAEKIKQECKIPVIVYDERLTSKLADSLTRGMNAGTKAHSIAAQKLLEDYLHSQSVKKET